MSRAGFSEAKIFRAIEQFRLDVLETPSPGAPFGTDGVVQSLCESVVGGHESLANLKAKDLAKFNLLVASVSAALGKLFDAGRLKSGHQSQPSGFAPGEYSMAFTDEGLIKPIRWEELRDAPLREQLELPPSNLLVLSIYDDATGSLTLGNKRTPDPSHRLKLARRPLRPKAAAVARYLLGRFLRRRESRVSWDAVTRAVRLDKTNKEPRKEAGRLIGEFNQHLEAVGAPRITYAGQLEISLPKDFPKISRPLTPKS